MANVDAIVAALPPPGKLKPGGAAEDAADGGADDAEEYSPEEDAAMGVAKALGIPSEKVDVKALCSALRDFNATSTKPTPET
jgi:ribosomal protein L12E/L44/L45/RPP1/RPP2